MKPNNVIDTTKITTYMECPRKYYLRHIKGITPTYLKFDLEFGLAVHSTFEYIHKKLLETNEGILMPSEELINEAYTDVFIPAYEPIEEYARKYKTKENFLTCLQDYWKKYSSEHMCVRYAEICGTILIDEKPFVFRSDSVYQNLKTGAYYINEIKTSSMDSERWSAQWQLSPQLIANYFGLQCLYGIEADAVYVSGLFFTSSGCYAARLPIRYSDLLIDEWIHMVQPILKYVLQHDDVRDYPMYMGYGRCVTFSTCPYFHLCAGGITKRSDLTELIECDEDFKIEFWNPLEA